MGESLLEESVRCNLVFHSLGLSEDPGQSLYPIPAPWRLLRGHRQAGKGCCEVKSLVWHSAIFPQSWETSAWDLSLPECPGGKLAGKEHDVHGWETQHFEASIGPHHRWPCERHPVSSDISRNFSLKVSR